MRIKIKITMETNIKIKIKFEIQKKKEIKEILSFYYFIFFTFKLPVAQAFIKHVFPSLFCAVSEASIS